MQMSYYDIAVCEAAQQAFPDKTYEDAVRAYYTTKEKMLSIGFDQMNSGGGSSCWFIEMAKTVLYIGDYTGLNEAIFEDKLCEIVVLDKRGNYICTDIIFLGDLINLWQ